MMKFEFQQDDRTNGTIFRAYISRDEISSRDMEAMVIRELAKMIAAHLAHHHFQEIVAKIDMQAVANLSVAQAAAEIRKLLGERLPNVVQHHHHEKQTVEYVPFPEPPK